VNSGRFLTFLLFSSAFMMTAVILQNYLMPDPQEDVAQQVEVGDGAPQVENNTEKTDDGNSTPASREVAGQPAGDAPVEETEAQTAPVETPTRTSSDEFVTMGSLNPDGLDRYLVTINKLGGTISRVELNVRDADGRYTYRDLIWEGGYIGCLDPVDTPDGVRVRTVGEGTPASVAGVMVGDLILAVDEEPITSADDFEDYLESRTKPGSLVKISVKRDGTEKQFEIGLTEKPIQVIRPEPGLVDDQFDFPESFILSLVKPGAIDEAWPELDRDMIDANWEVSKLTENLVELKFELSEAKLNELGYQGPITVFKRYKMPEVPVDAPADLTSRTFHLNLEVEIKNGSNQSQQLAYKMDGPTGLTAETWWYANKIHGRQTAIGYIAGARDVVGANGVNSYVFYGCPEIVKGAQKTITQVDYICDPGNNDVRARELKWVGVDSHYFNVSMIPNVKPGEPFMTNSVWAYVNSRRGELPEIPKNARLQKLVDCTFQMVAPADLAPGGSLIKSFDVFIGPKDPVVLKQYGLSDVRTFGWFSWCSIVLLKVLHFFYLLTFKTSYGLAIILLTVLVRSLMIPLSRKAALNAQMMQHLQPQMKEIADKYKDDMEKRAAAQRELYQKYKFNPFGGCFMMFFQLPVFYGLYKALNVDIALRDQPLIPGMQWCSNLAAPDQLFYWENWMPAVLAAPTGWLGPYFNILPILTMILFIAQQKLFTPPPTDDQQKMMQKMMTFMMIFMGVMFFKVAAGLCIYFITSSLWGIIERKLLPKPVLDTDKLALDGGNTRALKKQLKAEAAKTEKRDSEAEARRSRNAERKKKLKQRGN
jgi:YidC/Oxa1 family membrane protein insertase